MSSKFRNFKWPKTREAWTDLTYNTSNSQEKTAYDTQTWNIYGRAKSLNFYLFTKTGKKSPLVFKRISNECKIIQSLVKKKSPWWSPLGCIILHPNAKKYWKLDRLHSVLLTPHWGMSKTVSRSLLMMPLPHSRIFHVRPVVVDATERKGVERKMLSSCLYFYFSLWNVTILPFRLVW